MMMEEAEVESSVMNSGFGLHLRQNKQLGVQSCGEISSEDELSLSVLPRNTKVVVTGNNRTKSVLVGLEGFVKKAVGLGGWHWLVLTNGVEVKLQRNALNVIEAPTRNEEDDEIEYNNLMWNGSEMTSDDTQKPCRSRHRTRRTLESSHKTMSRSVSWESHSKGSMSPRETFTTNQSSSQKIDLSKLEIGALWKYWRHFNLVKVIPNPSKKQLIEAVQTHFMSQQMDELQVIVNFVKAAKRLKSM